MFVLSRAKKGVIIDVLPNQLLGYLGVPLSPDSKGPGKGGLSN
jgi:hypothetical protein